MSFAESFSRFEPCMQNDSNPTPVACATTLMQAPSNLGFNWGYSTSSSPIRNTTAASSVTPPATAPSPSPPSPTGREITRELILRCIERQGVRLPTKRDAHMEDRMMLKQTHLHLHTQASGPTQTHSSGCCSIIAACRRV